MHQQIKVHHIVATSANSTMGKDGGLPWSGFGLDMQRFRAMTLGHVVVMGSVTFKSLPNLLNDRFHIVLSRDPSSVTMEPWDTDRVFVAATIEEALDKASAVSVGLGKDRFYVIGGAQIYAATASVTDVIDLTLTRHIVNGDTAYPANLIHLVNENAGALSPAPIDVAGSQFIMTQRQGPYQSDAKPSPFSFEFITLEKVQ
jgi:dihydrofolate reductase